MTRSAPSSALARRTVVADNDLVAPVALRSAHLRRRVFERDGDPG